MTDHAAVDLTQIRSLVEELLRVLPQLETASVTEQVRVALLEADRVWALRLIMFMDGRLTEKLLPELLESALSHRFSFLARPILAKLGKASLQANLCPLLFAKLEEADDDEFRRAAELLEYIGLESDLVKLVSIAQSHPDPHVQEVGLDFAR